MFDRLCGTFRAGQIAHTIPRFWESLAMANSLRITVDELKNRMEGGEDFTMVDVRKPDVWTESDTMIPESIRVPLDKLEQNLPRIPKNRPVVAYCT
jgi:rhodanese-related sulfurtransferase